MIKTIKNFVKLHEAEVAAAGAIVTVAGSELALRAFQFGATSMTDTMNSTFEMLGSMMDGFATLVPHFINLIVAFIPLAILGAILAAVIGMIYMLPKFVKIDFHGKE